MQKYLRKSCEGIRDSFSLFYFACHADVRILWDRCVTVLLLAVAFTDCWLITCLAALPAHLCRTYVRRCQAVFSFRPGSCCLALQMFLCWMKAGEKLISSIGTVVTRCNQRDHFVRWKTRRASNCLRKYIFHNSNSKFVSINSDMEVTRKIQYLKVPQMLCSYDGNVLFCYLIRVTLVETDVTGENQTFCWINTITDDLSIRVTICGLVVLQSLAYLLEPWCRNAMNKSAKNKQKAAVALTFINDAVTPETQRCRQQTTRPTSPSQEVTHEISFTLSTSLPPSNISPKALRGLKQRIVDNSYTIRV